MPKILELLVVEDDPYFRADIAKKLRAYGNVRSVGTEQNASAALHEQKFDVAFIDLNLDGENAGLAVVQTALKRGTCPIVLTGNNDPLMVARAYEIGCKHYFSKLDVQADLERQLGFYLRSLLNEDMEKWLAQEFVSRSPAMAQVIQSLRYQNLNRDQRILLLGPTGVGKTKIAKLVHRLSEATMENFVHINMAEVPDNLGESVLFGHKRGAFTGANEDHIGFIERADKGTLFLDEIGSISLGLQKKLLKVLEEKEFTPLGSTQAVRSDFRLIAATCEEMPKLIESKRFRLDLYFRLKGIELAVPALRERREDIIPLVEHFSRQGARRISFSAAALEALTAYDWHGNVRELEQLVKSLAASSLGLIGYADLPLHVQRNRNPYEAEPEQKIYTRAISNFIQSHGLRRFIETVEREAFAEIFQRTEGNLSKTQLTLGISKSATYRIKAEHEYNERRNP